VLGRPPFGYFKLLGDRDRQRRFAASVVEGPAACMPLEITGAIAGRPFAMRFKAVASCPISSGEHPRTEARGGSVEG
jgi:hypothetical protein